MKFQLHRSQKMDKLQHHYDDVIIKTYLSSFNIIALWMSKLNTKLTLLILFLMEMFAVFYFLNVNYSTIPLIYLYLCSFLTEYLGRTCLPTDQ